MVEFVGELPGVTEVNPSMVFTPSVVAREDVRGREVRTRLLADLPFFSGFGHLVGRGQQLGQARAELADPVEPGIAS